MSIFNLTDEKMKETSSTFTAHEIYQQPATWRKTCAQPVSYTHLTLPTTERG